MFTGPEPTLSGWDISAKGKDAASFLSFLLLSFPFPVLFTSNSQFPIEMLWLSCGNVVAAH